MIHFRNPSNEQHSLRHKSLMEKRKKHREYQAAYRARPKAVKVQVRERAIAVAIRSNAKRRGLEFDLTADDLSIPEFCPVLGIPIILDAGLKMREHSPSVDRINPKKGYVSGNVRVISQRANMLKSNATIEELELVLVDLKAIDLAARPM